MSPARKHRDRHAAAPASIPSSMVAPREEGGQTTARVAPDLTPARAHRIVQAAIAPAADNTAAPRAARDTIADEMMLRLTHDLRRLKQIASIQLKIAAKVEMLPAYRAWCDALLNAYRADAGTAAEVLPTIMVWCIDTGDWMRALELAEHVVRHDVALPARYARSAPALITEEIATAALKLQAAGKSFPLDVLDAVEELTAGADMHDEIRAKLHKAIGFELARHADETEGDMARPFIVNALAALTRAQSLHDRVGAKTRMAQMEKLLAANLAAFPPPAPERGESATPPSTDTNTAG
ncbi:MULTISPECIES: phage terminase small subunit [unclassified Sphingomonas]|uniref:phage terminase small subunit n=1 Tax=unclassified Sphingomonas TaxID=196159 RepID=UPI00226A979A|nr:MULTISPECIES: phage terminase small subunit [unclassified Sphingomonas]